MKPITQYMSEDGKIFTTEEECRTHEASSKEATKVEEFRLAMVNAGYSQVTAKAMSKAAKLFLAWQRAGVLPNKKPRIRRPVVE